MKTATMETMSEAIARLESEGFEESFQAGPQGVLEIRDEATFEPESLLVEETARFEGASNPDDSAVLFALRTRDGRHRGTFVASFGTDVEPRTAAALHRLNVD